MNCEKSWVHATMNIISLIVDFGAWTPMVLFVGCIVYLLFDFLVVMIFSITRVCVTMYRDISRFMYSKKNALRFIKTCASFKVFKYTCENLREHTIVFKYNIHSDLFLDLVNECLEVKQKILYVQGIGDGNDVDLTDLFHHIAIFYGSPCTIKYDIRITWGDVLGYIKEKTGCHSINKIDIHDPDGNVSSFEPEKMTLDVFKI